jgi:hypothetical protein
MPRIADYEAAIVFSCLVHCGCPIDPFLLQHMLARPCFFLSCNLLSLAAAAGTTAPLQL